MCLSSEMAFALEAPQVQAQTMITNHIIDLHCIAKVHLHKHWKILRPSPRLIPEMERFTFSHSNSSKLSPEYQFSSLKINRATFFSLQPDMLAHFSIHLICMVGKWHRVGDFGVEIVYTVHSITLGPNVLNYCFDHCKMHTLNINWTCKFEKHYHRNIVWISSRSHLFCSLFLGPNKTQLLASMCCG